MKTLYYTPFSVFWKEVALSLKRDGILCPVVWVGEEEICFDIENCLHWDTWGSFRLQQVANWNVPRVPDRAALRFFETLDRREYFTYLKLLDRVDLFGSFTFTERDRWLKNQVKYWLQVLRYMDISLVVFNNTPHLPDSYPIHLAAKYLKARTLFLNVTPFEHVYYLAESLNTIGKIDQGFTGLSEKAVRTYEYLRWKSLPKNDESDMPQPYYMALQKKYDNRLVSKLSVIAAFGEMIFVARAIRRAITKKDRSLRASDKFLSYKEQGVPYWDRPRGSIFKEAKASRDTVKYVKRLREEYEACSVRYDNPDDPFIYVALHYQPEETTIPRGGLFADQIELVTLLAAALPEGWNILVKEHPSQFGLRLHGYQGRVIGFYEEICAIPNVELVAMETSSTELLETCTATATISGTVGWEGLIRGKPCLLFGRAWYSECGGVVHVTCFEDCVEAVRTIQSGLSVQIDVERFLKRFSKSAFMLDHDEANSRIRLAVAIQSYLGIGESVEAHVCSDRTNEEDTPRLLD